ncbi:hypothetical protein RvY_18984 [Ramazzottius varieornatus]|uniref:Uncharacterized protein n=1 Tax=Ramazzottius varieornatus TaxID=947166 RepID=A0A1D1WAC8_RAMVA|nr:hypothetical protein RvY_18984 [Ramazzottius varieornatus]
MAHSPFFSAFFQATFPALLMLVMLLLLSANSSRSVSVGAYAMGRTDNGRLQYEAEVDEAGWESDNGSERQLFHRMSRVPGPQRLAGREDSYQQASSDQRYTPAYNYLRTLTKRRMNKISCLKSCVGQHVLHPIQCHSLC